jgi:hypothetical protein
MTLRADRLNAPVMLRAVPTIVIVFVMRLAARPFCAAVHAGDIVRAWNAPASPIAARSHPGLLLVAVSGRDFCTHCVDNAGRIDTTMQDFISMFFRDRLEKLSLSLEQGIQRGLFGSRDSAGILGAATCAVDLFIERTTGHGDEAST